MGFLSNLVKNLFGNSRGDQRSYYFYARCDSCGEVLKGRVDMYNDISTRYSGTETVEGYFTRKVLVGSKKCYRPIDVTLEFDNRRRLINQVIQGGQSATEEEYLEQNA